MDRKMERALADCRRLIDTLGGSLPEHLDVQELVTDYRLPYAAITYRECLVWRAWALAEPAVVLIEQGNPIPAIVLTRSVMQTFAVLHALNRHVRVFLESGADRELQEFLDRALAAPKDWVELPNPIDALASGDREDRAVEVIKRHYDVLTEFAHPNWQGTFGAFGVIDGGGHRVQYGPRYVSVASNMAVHALAVTLRRLVYLYAEPDDLYVQLRERLRTHDPAHHGEPSAST